MIMKHGLILNIPEEPLELYREAKDSSFRCLIDEKSTLANPSGWTRQRSRLSFEDAFEIISNSKPHWTILYRDMEYLTMNEKSYWEFGGCNIGSNNYGDVYIFINVEVEVAEKIFEKYGLEKQ